jgi:hypothetical protein
LTSPSIRRRAREAGVDLSQISGSGADGRITQSHLDTALALQKEQRLPLGQVLTKLHYVTDEVMRQALGRQVNIPYVDLENILIDRELARAINRGYAKKHALVPLARNGKILTVVMDDPTANAVIDDLARMTHYTITVVTASSRSIQRAFRRLYEDAADQTETVATVISTPESTDENATIDEVASRELTKVVSLPPSEGHRRGVQRHPPRDAPLGRIRFRVDGVLRQPQFGDVQFAFDQIRREVASRIKILAKLDIAERRRPQDGSFPSIGTATKSRSTCGCRSCRHTSARASSSAFSTGRAPVALSRISISRPRSWRCGEI